ncbi:MAG: GNAT family N-acetyltransferase [Thalassotalea sp.]
MLLNEYQQCLMQCAFRGQVVLVGDIAWRAQQINYFYNAAINLTDPDKQATKVLTYCREPAFYRAAFEHLTELYVEVDERSYRHYLGTESAGVIYFDDDINPDIYAALSGTIQAGGIFLLGCEQLPNEQDNLYLQRFYRTLHQAKTCIYIFQNAQQQLATNSHNQAVIANLNETLLTAKVDSNSAEPLPDHCLTYEQVQAVTAIIKVAKGHRKRPLTITADRGRGKSSALALACIALINRSQAAIDIIITAPQLSALTSFFKLLKIHFPDAKINKSSITVNNASIQFLPLDVLLKELPKTHLLLVDEAAALPLYLVDKLFSHYHRLVFSSTLHGYEGAGRGFAIKHQALHQKHQLPLQHLVLNTPIRWSENDPLEALTFATCLLNAELDEISADTIVQLSQLPAKLSYLTLTPAQLFNDEGLLRQVFAVLVTAHYQTSPADLKLLLTNDKIIIRAVSVANKIVAVAVILAEGDVAADVVNGIKAGKRRIKDHFLPQSLLVHCGLTQSFDYSYWRVMRIAVHPGLQNRKIGQFLLKKITQDAKHQDIDMLGTSFGLSTSLFNFWSRAQWNIARIGFSQDHTSGEHSGLLVKALNEQARSFVDVISIRFYQSFTYLLSEQYQNLSAALVLQVLTQMPKNNVPAITSMDQQAVNDFAQGIKQYDQAAYSLHLWLLHQCMIKKEHEGQGIATANDELWQQQGKAVLIKRLLQKQPLNHVISEFNFAGKKAFNTYLKELVDQLK